MRTVLRNNAMHHSMHGELSAATRLIAQPLRPRHAHQ